MAKKRPLLPHESGMRPCLGLCPNGKKFMSRDAGHRQCPKCEKALRKVYARRVAGSTIYDGGSVHNMSHD